MAPYKLNWSFHEGSHTNSWLHVVREYEEGSHCSDNTAMKHHTDTHTCHSQLANTCLEEGTAKVVTCEGMCLVKETISLVRVAEVG